MGVTPIKFGTDGWRAVIAEDYTFENVRACAQGVASLLKANGLADRGLVVGYDTRFASEDFAAAAAEAAAAHGVDVALSDRACPTPAVSYNVLARKAGGGIVITASHNPGQWNGFKYKPDYGGSASPEVVAELEGHIADAQRNGSMTRAARRATVTTFDADRAVSGAVERARRPRRHPAERLRSRSRLDARGWRGADRTACRRRKDAGNRAARRAQPGLPRHGAARAHCPQPRAADGGGRRFGRFSWAGHRRRRRPARPRWTNMASSSRSFRHWRYWRSICSKCAASAGRWSSRSPRRACSTGSARSTMCPCSRRRWDSSTLAR